jgi:hypothetical protein
MNYMPKIDRRSFLVSTAGAAGGLALGFNLPIDAAEAADAAKANEPETATAVA